MEREKETWYWPKSSHLSVVQYDKEAPSRPGVRKYEWWLMVGGKH